MRIASIILRHQWKLLVQAGLLQSSGTTFLSDTAYCEELSVNSKSTIKE